MTSLAERQQLLSFFTEAITAGTRTFKAAASIASAWVGKASAELIDTPFE